jgi:hypothetical protein
MQRSQYIRPWHLIRKLLILSGIFLKAFCIAHHRAKSPDNAAPKNYSRWKFVFSPWFFLQRKTPSRKRGSHFVGVAHCQFITSFDAQSI